MPGGSLFQLDIGAEYLVRAKIDAGHARQGGMWDAGTHIRMCIAGSSTIWVPLTTILPWPTIEAFRGFLEL